MITLTYPQAYGYIAFLVGFLLLQGGLIGIQKTKISLLVLCIVCAIGGLVWPIVCIYLVVSTFERTSNDK